MDDSKKEFILKETLGYFLKYGVKNFTMDDIANKLGVSKKTLYQMFCNKENLLFEVVDELWKSFLDEIHKIYYGGASRNNEGFSIKKDTWATKYATSGSALTATFSVSW